MAASTKALPGRTLGYVKYPSTCPECQAPVAKGDSAWYVTKADSHTGRGQIFCNRACATDFYRPLRQNREVKAPEPKAQPSPNLSPEAAGGVKCRHSSPEPDPGYLCSLQAGHEGRHEAWTSYGTEPVTTWHDEDIAIAPEVVEAVEETILEVVNDTVTINGVEISTKGKHAKFALCLRVAAATGPDGQKCNLLLVGPAGTGKSTLAKQVHEALGLVFGQEARTWCSLSLASDTPSSKLFGYKDANGVFQRTPFHGTYTGGGTDLIDELDNGSDTVVAGLNQAIANGEAAFAEGNEAEHEHHRLIATANTFGKGGDRVYVARKQLDGASLDRFVTVELDYDEALEHRLAHRAGEGAPKADIDELIATVRQARRRAAEKKLPLIFSPRACIDGALLLASGIDLDTVLEIRVFPGVSADVRAGLR